jgi:hypothetical protein
MNWGKFTFASTKLSEDLDFWKGHAFYTTDRDGVKELIYFCRKSKTQLKFHKAVADANAYTPLKHQVVKG